MGLLERANVRKYWFDLKNPFSARQFSYREKLQTRYNQASTKRSGVLMTNVVKTGENTLFESVHCMRFVKDYSFATDQERIFAL